MSYILDALKRAESERERGAVPGLHSQSLHPSVALANTPSLGQLSALLLVLALLVGLWLWWTQAEPLPEPVAAKPAPAAPAAPAATQVLVPSPALSAAPTQPVRLGSEPAALQANAPRGTAPARNTPALAAVVPTQPLQPSAAAAPSSSAQSSAVLASALPEGIPAQLVGKIPALRITGAVYASDPKQRLLLVNNLVLHQGDQLTPELTLETIEANAAVFNYQGTRFRLPQ